MFFLRLATAVTAFGIASLYGIAIALLRRDRSGVAHAYARVMQRLVQPILGLNVVLRGERNLTSTRPCVFVVNHQSAFDVPVLSGIYPPGTVLVAKKELRAIPLFGWLYEATGNILIDRGHNARALQRLREAEEAIRERGVSVWIFPEGTRGKVSGELLPFKKGAFHLAIGTGVPIVPIAVSPVRELFDMEGRQIRSGTIEVRVLPPVPTSGLSERDVPDLMGEVHARMSSALRELRTTPGTRSGALQLKES